MQDSHVRTPLRSSGTFVLPWSSKTASPAGGASCISMGRGFVAGARYVTEKIVNAFLSGVSNSGEDEIRRNGKSKTPIEFDRFYIGLFYANRNE